MSRFIILLISFLHCPRTYPQSYPQLINTFSLTYSKNKIIADDFASEQFYPVINNRVPISFFTFAENTVCAETQQPEEKTKV
ncbi:hypothetical protein [Chryseobacterium lathyri]|uniref:Uncharacterized protein n=1 Tax=Chryseobacterium lathyri TaxID=395933 RepID=A0ABT9SPP8_9FLAO|nr:hypothetical protein [Chryseobacterium lathyri]MDP9961418.1 hypothetical protein [Chryseobacterium lathyri]MDQ0068076.1 hypothetical protein [Chryseobacterium lathyri]